MKSEFNFEEFKEKAIFAVKKAFLEIIDEYKEFKVYGFTLTCDSAARSIGVVANTKEALEKQIEDDEGSDYYKFCEQEWEIWDAADDEFQHIRNSLVEFQENNKDKISNSETFIYTDFFEEFRDKIFHVCVEALVEIKNEDFFKHKCNGSIFINFTVPEYLDEDYSIEVFSKLNSGIVVKEYREYMKSPIT